MSDYFSTGAIVQLNSQNTTDAYADYQSPIEFFPYTFMTLMVKNTGGSNSLTYKILGSIDGGTTYDFTVLPDTVIAPSSSDSRFINKSYSTLKIQVKSTSSGNATSVTGKFVTKR